MFSPTAGISVASAARTRLGNVYSDLAEIRAYHTYPRTYPDCDGPWHFLYEPMLGRPEQSVGFPNTCPLPSQGGGGSRSVRLGAD